MSHAEKRLHCLRPLSEAPPYAATDSALNGFSQGPAADAVSRALVRLLRKRAGRGPTKVRTDISPELAIVTLEDSLTAAERTLVSEGDRALVTRFRSALHDGMRADAVTAVEEITGRQVVAYLTAHEHDPDRTVIAFHFSPAAGLEKGR